MSYNFSPHGHARAHADYCMSAYRVLLRRADYDDDGTVPSIAPLFDAIGLMRVFMMLRCCTTGRKIWMQHIHTHASLFPYIVWVCVDRPASSQKHSISYLLENSKMRNDMKLVKGFVLNLFYQVWSPRLYIWEWRRWVGGEGGRHAARVKLNCYIANMYAVKSICDATHSRRHIDFGKKKFNFVKSCASTRRHSARFGNNLVQRPKL